MELYAAKESLITIKNTKNFLFHVRRMVSPGKAVKDPSGAQGPQRDARQALGFDLL